MDPLEHALHDHLNDFLAGAISLDALKDWLVGATWNIEERASPAAVQLAYAVELALAEASGGYLTQDELRAQLRELVERVPASS
jgi:hypothetical protein